MEKQKEKPIANTVPKKNKLGLVGWLLAIAMPSTYIAPFVLLFLIIYLGTESTVFLILTIIGALLYILSVVFCVIKLKQPIDPSKTHVAPSNDDDSDAAAQTAGLMFGAGLLGHYIGKHHKSSSEKASDDWLWQEKYRSNDDYYD